MEISGLLRAAPRPPTLAGQPSACCLTLPRSMHFETELRAWVPRSQREHCGVKTIGVSWSGKHPPFTWMFGVFGVAVVPSAATTRIFQPGCNHFGPFR